MSISGQYGIQLEDSLKWLAEEMALKRQFTPKTIIYVRDINHITDIRNLFDEICGDRIHHPMMVSEAFHLHAVAVFLHKKESSCRFHAMRI